jgi:hypothetical protein
MTNVGLVHCHFIKYGIDTISTLQQNGNLVNIVDEHSHFTKDEVCKQDMELYGNCDNTSKTLPLVHYSMNDL